MTIKVGINGFGRVGRTFLRNFLDQNPKDIEVVCINDAYMAPDFMCYIFENDSGFGKYGGQVRNGEDSLIIDGREIHLQQQDQPNKINWKKFGVDIVIESTGAFTTRDQAKGHLDAGAKKVIISAPSRSDDVPMYIRGVNFDKYNPDQQIISGACETTYCAAVICNMLLQKKYKVNQVAINLVHGATSEQRTVDGPPLHGSWRTGRSVQNNIVPTEAADTKALEKVLPALNGKVMGNGVQIPITNVSYVTLNLSLGNSITRDNLVDLIQQTSKNTEFEELLATNDKPLVSGDFIGRNESVIVDLNRLVVHENMVQLPVWFDHEWSYSRRLCELLTHVASQSGSQRN